jgi:hypothetical protein
MTVLAAAMLAGGLMATDAQARVAGGGGHGVGSLGFRGGIQQGSMILNGSNLAQPPQQLPQQSKRLAILTPTVAPGTCSPSSPGHQMLRYLGSD